MVVIDERVAPREAYRCGGTRAGPAPSRCNRRVADIENGYLVLACERCGAEHVFLLAATVGVPSGSRSPAADPDGYPGVARMRILPYDEDAT